MARALFAAIVVLACVGASLAVTDFCEADCVKEIYANNCGGAVCVAGVSTAEERDGLCSEQCQAALGGADMLACLSTIDDRADWDVIQGVVLNVRSQICTPFVAPEIPVKPEVETMPVEETEPEVETMPVEEMEPEVETMPVEETEPVVEAEAPSTADVVPVVVTVEEKEAPEVVSMDDGAPMEAPVDEPVKEGTPDETPEDESAEVTTPEVAPEDESAEEDTPEEAPEDESAEETTPEVAPEDESAEEATPEEAPEDESPEEASAPETDTDDAEAMVPVASADGSRRLLRSA